MAGEFAKGTSVPVDRSRSEVERVLSRYGATSFAYGWDQERAVIEFAAQNRRVRFVLPLPDRNAREITHHSRGMRTQSAREQAFEQACRQRWRALVLVIKAKLEAVEVGITSFEDEFAMAFVLPDGSVVADHVRPAVADAYATGLVRPMLQLGAPDA